MTYIIAFANQKGGVAKTTSVVSLAGALAQQGIKILAIDLDAQADLTLSFGLNPDQVVGTIADVVLNSQPITQLIRNTSILNVDILPANPELELAERFLPVRQSYETTLRDILDTSTAIGKYQVILLDCPPYLGAVTVNALTAADLLVIPTQPEYFSAHALRNMMTIVRRVRSQHNPGLIYRILITMQDRRNRIHRHLSEQIQAAFGDGLLRTVIEVDTKLRESSIAGMPINFYMTRSRGTLQYNALAQELAQYAQKAIAQPA
jgi:chromosome partitioning protein